MSLEKSIKLYQKLNLFLPLVHDPGLIFRGYKNVDETAFYFIWITPINMNLFRTRFRP